MKKHPPIIGNTLALAGMIVLVGASACAFDTPRDPQPEGLLRLPGSLSVSGDGRFLYAVGTNFDLGYGTGALQSYELSRFDDKIDSAASWPVIFDPTEGLVGEVQVGSFGGNLSVRIDAQGGERLFLPVRGTGTVAVADVTASGALGCVLPEGSTSGEIGVACDRVEVPLEAPNGEVVDDPYASVVVGDRLWVGSLSAQYADPDDTESSLVTYFARLGVEDASSAEVLSSDRMMPREMRVGPDGQIWAVGQALTGSTSLAELRIYDPASFELGVDSARTFAISGASGGGEARGLRLSSDGTRLFVITRYPDRVLIFDRAGSYGNESISLKGAVSLPTTPASLELISRPQGELLAITGQSPDGLVIVDPDLQEVVGLLDGTHCDTDGVCPRGSRTTGRRSTVRDPGGRPFGIVVIPTGDGMRLWLSAFGLQDNETGGLLAVDMKDLARPWELAVVAAIRSEEP